MTDNQNVEDLCREFAAGFSNSANLSSPLTALLRATRGNAVGIWRRVDDRLISLGFQCDSEFPADVAQAFTAATADVSLTQTGLGIVHAVVTDDPAVALLPAMGGRLPGSGGWLEKFGSIQSLSVPVRHNGQIVGVLALSTRFEFGERDETWQVLVSLAENLGQIWPAGR